jgi:hypothetical protein
MNRPFGSRDHTLLALSLALLAVSELMDAVHEQSRGRAIWAAVLTVLAAVFAYRAGHGSRTV